MESAPAGNAMPLMTLGVLFGALALPPVLPATVLPFKVVTVPTTGCATCSVTV